MSIMCCIYVPEGIVMAADSRLTRTKPTQSVELPVQNEQNQKIIMLQQTTYTLSDNAQKVLLIKKNAVGVSFCGNAIINGMTVADYIRNFEIEKVLETDTTEEVAQKLSVHYGKTDTHFFVCGYDNDIPYVYDVNGAIVTRSNVEQPVLPTQNTKDVATEETELQVGVPETQYLEKKEQDVVETKIPNLIYSATWAGRKVAITKIVNNPPILNADWATMPLKDAIDFAEFLIDTTIKYERFCDDIQTCGGDIDILVITKDEAFWKQHKVYNPKN